MLKYSSLRNFHSFLLLFRKENGPTIKSFNLILSRKHPLGLPKEDVHSSLGKTEPTEVIKHLSSALSLDIEQVKNTLEYSRKGTLAHLGSKAICYSSFVYVSKKYPKLQPLSVSDYSAYLCRDESLKKAARFLKLHFYSFQYENTFLVEPLKTLVGAVSAFRGREQAYSSVYENILRPEQRRVAKDMLLILKLFRPCLILNHICQTTEGILPHGELYNYYYPNGRKNYSQVFIYVGQKLLGKGTGKTVESARKLASEAALFQNYRSLIETCPLPAELDFIREEDAISLIIKTQEPKIPLISEVL